MQQRTDLQSAVRQWLIPTGRGFLAKKQPIGWRHDIPPPYMYSTAPPRNIHGFPRTRFARAGGLRCSCFSSQIREGGSSARRCAAVRTTLGLPNIFMRTAEAHPIKDRRSLPAAVFRGRVHPPPLPSSRHYAARLFKAKKRIVSRKRKLRTLCVIPCTFDLPKTPKILRKFDRFAVTLLLSTPYRRHTLLQNSTS